MTPVTGRPAAGDGRPGAVHHRAAPAHHGSATRPGPVEVGKLVSSGSPDGTGRTTVLSTMQDAPAADQRHPPPRPAGLRRQRGDHGHRARRRAVDGHLRRGGRAGRAAGQGPRPAGGGRRRPGGDLPVEQPGATWRPTWPCRPWGRSSTP